jgi:hypothetical protein
MLFMCLIFTIFTTCFCSWSFLIYSSDSTNLYTEQNLMNPFCYYFNSLRLDNRCSVSH